jgi:hypothetical protein
MKRSNRRPAHILLRTTAALLITIVILSIQGCASDSALKLWHTEKLTEEFTASKAVDQVRSFDDYLKLEQKLFRQLDEKIYANTATGPAHALERYSASSSADPRQNKPDWNRSFEFRVEKPVGGVLLLHGMSDSP